MFDLAAIIKLNDASLLMYGVAKLLTLKEELGSTKKSALSKSCKIPLDFEKMKEEFHRFK